MAINGPNHAQHANQTEGQTTPDTANSGHVTPNEWGGHNTSVLCGSSKAPGSPAQHASAVKTSPTVTQTLNNTPTLAKDSSLRSHNISAKVNVPIADSVSNVSTAALPHADQGKKHIDESSINQKPVVIGDTNQDASVDQIDELSLDALFAGDEQVMNLVAKEGNIASVEALVATMSDTANLDHILLVKMEPDNSASFSKLSDAHAKDGLPPNTSILNMKDWTLHGAAGTTQPSHLKALHQHLISQGQTPPSTLTLVQYNPQNWAVFNSKLSLTFKLIGQEIAKNQDGRDEESKIENHKNFTHKNNKAPLPSKEVVHNRKRDNSKVEISQGENVSYKTEINEIASNSIDKSRELIADKAKESKKARREARDQLDSNRKFEETKLENKNESINKE